jgi:SAM-dependent methyltransferase
MLSRSRIRSNECTARPSFDRLTLSTTKQMILEEPKLDSLCRYAKLTSDILGVDYESAAQWGRVAFDYFNSADPDRRMRTLENRWYETMRAGSPDYSVYDAPELMGDMWACWIIYARSYLNLIEKRIASEIYPTRVVDLGCGLGFSTQALRQIFPYSDVIGTNIETSAQTKVCRYLAKSSGFEIATDVKDIGQTDLVFASEYFEHFEAPIDHLKDVLQYLQPQWLLIANSFNTYSIGHFDMHSVDGKRYDGRATSKLFNSYLREQGYTKVRKFWNDKPTYWIKQ